MERKIRGQRKRMKRNRNVEIKSKKIIGNRKKEQREEQRDRRNERKEIKRGKIKEKRWERRSTT